MDEIKEIEEHDGKLRVRAILRPRRIEGDPEWFKPGDEFVLDQEFPISSIEEAEMVEAAEVVYMCNVCTREWSIEPEPSYRTWAEMGHDEPTEVQEEFVMCPFCGAGNVSKRT